jgi:hypothetical protein
MGSSEAIFADLERDRRMLTSDLQIRVYVHNYSRKSIEKVTGIKDPVHGNWTKACTSLDFSGQAWFN